MRTLDETLKEDPRGEIHLYRWEDYELQRELEDNELRTKAFAEGYLAGLKERVTKKRS